MSNRKMVFSLGALIGAAALAPGLSVLLALMIAGAMALASGSTGALGGVLMTPFILFQIIIATVLGWPSAMIFGGIGAFGLGRIAPLHPAWPWSLAGAAAAVTYILASLVLARVIPAVAGWTAPWLLLIGDEGRAEGQPYDIASLVVVAGGIVLAGGIAGLLYRAFLKRSLIVYRTYSPLSAASEELNADPDISERPRHEEG
ncbi:MAG: hypothetical protein EBR82_14525 [Caulobacteraceae bacterium]|nr:hypothetical protein [Caulobacteraceae bacterium]